MDVRNLDKPKIAATVEQANKLRNDVVRRAFGLLFHVEVTELGTIDFDDPVAATNALVDAYEEHRASAYSSTTQLGAHKAADATNTVTAPVATNEATAITRANQLKTKANAHFLLAASHIAADATNVITAATATDTATLDDLIEDIATQLAAHFAAGFSSEKINIVAA